MILVIIKNEFDEQLNNKIIKIEIFREIIIFGDLNRRTGKKIHNKIIG